MKLRSILLGSLFGCIAAFALNVALQQLVVQQTSAPGLLRPLAEHGMAEAQYVLGMTLISVDETAEEGAEPDYAQAARWFQKAAAQGLANAQHQFGRMHAQGLGVPKDREKAEHWYLQAAEQSHGEGQRELAGIYSDGRGLHQDLVTAHMWINLAAASSIGQIGEEYAQIRDGIAAEMTTEQITEAQRLAREWRPKSWAELRASALE